MTNEIRIYVACLAAYNNGILHGVWLDATQDIGDLWEGINTMLKASPIKDAEEWAIHDYEGYGNLSLSEYMGIQKAHDLAVFIEEHGALGVLVLEYFGGDLAEASEALEDKYLGAYESIEDFAEETYPDNVPEGLAYYIDWKIMAYDMERSGDIFYLLDDQTKVEADGSFCMKHRYHVFSGH
jgi:antirestriction protein